MRVHQEKILILLLFCCMACYGVLLHPFTDYMKNKPFVEKVGYTPNADLVKMLSADQKQSIAAALIFKVIVYYGTLVEKVTGKLDIPADYPAMSRTIHSGVKLDPYNMDGYYFAQAFLVWDVRKIDVANELLKYGMKYRSWDFQLPFFAGFNYAYFLKDYDNAAKQYQRAAELSGNPLFANLAGRYFQESGQTEMAIRYLSMMAKQTGNTAIRKNFQLRLKAFQEVRKIEQARDLFVSEKKRLPASLAELVKLGFLKTKPSDPYGGTFYLTSDGKVRTTSKFTEKSIDKMKE